MKKKCCLGHLLASNIDKVQPDQLLDNAVTRESHIGEP